MSRLFPARAAFAASVMCVANAVPAATLVDQFDSVVNRAVTSSKPSDVGTGPSAYDDFTLSGSGTIEQLNVWGKIDTAGFGVGSGGGAIVTFRANEPGIFGSPDIPGNVLYTRKLGFTNTPGAEGLYGYDIGNENFRQFSIVLPAGDGFAYSADTRYWVGVQMVQGIGGFSWSARGPETPIVAPNPPANGAPSAIDAAGDGGFTSHYKTWAEEDFISGLPARWVYNTSSLIPGNGYSVDMALQLQGTSSAVPEPGAITAIAALSGGLLLRRRRRA